MEHITKGSQTTILITHNKNQLAYFDKIVLMHNGNLIICDTLENMSALKEYKIWESEANKISNE